MPVGLHHASRTKSFWSGEQQQRVHLGLVGTLQTGKQLMVAAAAERSRGQAGCEWLYGYCAFLQERHAAIAGGEGVVPQQQLLFPDEGGQGETEKAATAAAPEN
jgi:hypothetical protein